MMDEGDRLLARALAATALLGGLVHAGLAMLGPGGAAAVPRVSAARVKRRIHASGAMEQRPAPAAAREATRAMRAVAGTGSFVAQVPPSVGHALRLPPEAHGSLQPVRGAWPALRPPPSVVSGTSVPPQGKPDLAAPVTAAPVAWSWTVATATPESQAAAPGPIAAPVPQSAVLPADPAPALRPPPPPPPGPVEADEKGSSPFDEVRLAQWLDAHLDEAAWRPPRGGTGFDPRLSPGWPGTLQGPWGWGG